MERIYIAGPEVFLPNALEVLQAKKDLCAQAGHVGLSPLDTEISLRNDYACGLTIARANEELINSCSVVIANITPWHGPHADVGTCVEIGYARGKGKKVYAYTHAEQRLQVERLKTYFQTYYSNSITKDELGFQRELLHGTLLEDFGMLDNLMIEGAVLGSGGFALHSEIEGDAALETFNNLKGFQLCLSDLSP